MRAPGTRPILILELAGIPFIVFLGSALHFTFEWSGENPLVGVFSAVNESVWEHLKLSFWPALLYAIMEHRYLRGRTKRFLPAKAVGLYLMPLSIVSFFYLYRAFLEESLALDISIFILAVVIGQLASYKLMVRKGSSGISTGVSLLALALLAVLFVVFTFSPPRLPIFEDPTTGGYGIGA